MYVFRFLALKLILQYYPPNDKQTLTNMHIASFLLKHQDSYAHPLVYHNNTLSRHVNFSTG